MTPSRHQPDSSDHKNGELSAPLPDGGNGLVRNSILNFLGQVLPLVVALFAIPFIVKGFGLERFGLLSLAWMLLGYFAYLDLGLGRATVWFVAERLREKDEQNIAGIVWGSLAINTIVGALIGVLMWLAAPLLAARVFTVPAALVDEARRMFIVLAFAIPVITNGAALRGVLEAAQRFDIVNAVKAPSNIAVFVIPLIGMAFSAGLPAITAWMVLSRVATALIYWVYAAKMFPGLLRRFSLHSKQMHALIRYGGWVTLTNFLNPVMFYGERLLIAALLPLGILAYYTAPFEMISRLGIFPHSIALALFPAFSYAGAQNPGAVRERLILQPSKYLLLILTPLTALFVFFAPEILQLWLGDEFRRQGSLVLQILAGAFFFNALAYITSTAVQGLGRPELKAKLDIGQSILFIGISWMLIKQFGIQGAAVAKLLVFAADAVFLAWFSKRLLNVRAGDFFPKTLRRLAFASALFLLSGFLMGMNGQWLFWRAGIFLILVSAYFALFWKIAVPENERLALHVLWQRFISARNNEIVKSRQMPTVGESNKELDLYSNRKID